MPAALALTHFVDAVFDPASSPPLAEARAALEAEAGAATVVEAAAVIATFQRMNRFTDATGVPLDATTEMVSRELRAELGVNAFASAANTAPPPTWQRLLGHVARPFTRIGMWVATRIGQVRGGDN